jgi:peptidoglycan/xylan/chitin deacetylase (PgdA/CDA1 family)
VLRPEAGTRLVSDRLQDISVKNMIRDIYRGMRSVLNHAQKAHFSKIIFDIGLKPSVLKDSNKHAGFPGKADGGMIISADFEMAWAFRYSKRDVDPLAMARMEREHVPKLLELFHDHSIPITWATVGHLFLESCKKGDHDWMRRIPHFDDHWKFTSGDWFAHDPYTDFHRDSAWYAPDLIEQILRSSVGHEFGCHTFSHIDCSDKNCPPGVLEDEITACKLEAQKWGIDLKSFVFPGGTNGNYQIIKEHGFRIYRQKMKHDLAYPCEDDLGLLVTSSTSSFGRGSDWSADYYVQRYKVMIEKAIKTRTAAHFWLHPSVDDWTLRNVIPPVLRYAAEQRDRGRLWIGTMGQMADHVLTGGD